MKLYDVPRETFVTVMEDVRVPPGCAPINKGETVFFDHVDGMYSLCMDRDKKEFIHLAAFTEVEIAEELNR